MIEGRPPVGDPGFYRPESLQKRKFAEGHQTLPPNLKRARQLPEIPPVAILLAQIRHLTPGAKDFIQSSAHIRKDLVQALNGGQITAEKYVEILKLIQTKEKQHQMSPKSAIDTFHLASKFSKNIFALRGVAFAEAMPSLKSLLRVVVNVLFYESSPYSIKPSVDSAQKLVMASETISLKMKNLSDYKLLEGGRGTDPEIFADQLLRDLHEANGKVPPMSVFRGMPVEESNRGTFQTLLALINNNREAFFYVVAAKLAKENNQVYFCKPIQVAMMACKTEVQANEIGKFLMCEVSQIRGAYLELDMDRFKQLKNDPQIRENPLLLKAVLKAGKEMQIEAMRKVQMSLLQDIVRKLDKENWREIIESISLMPKADNLDLKAVIKYVAKQSTTCTEAALTREVEALRQKGNQDHLDKESTLARLQLSLMQTK